jgi:hypothetical protein
MKRRIQYYLPLLLTVLGLMLWGCGEAPYPTDTDSVAEVLNKRGALPHDGGCVSYCARSIVYVFLGEAGTELPLDLTKWVPFDANADGKIQSCLAEKWGPNGEHCIEFGPQPNLLGCPEFDVDGDGIGDRCVLPGDGWGLWCRLMHDQDPGH